MRKFPRQFRDNVVATRVGDRGSREFGVGVSDGDLRTRENRASCISQCSDNLRGLDLQEHADALRRKGGENDQPRAENRLEGSYGVSLHKKLSALCRASTCMCI